MSSNPLKLLSRYAKCQLSPLGTVLLEPFIVVEAAGKTFHRLSKSLWMAGASDLLHSWRTSSRKSYIALLVDEVEVTGDVAPPRHDFDAIDDLLVLDTALLRAHAIDSISLDNVL